MVGNMNKNYKPIALCDTEGMDEAVWLKLRAHGPHFDDPSHPDYIKYGVGGSTVAGIMGLSPWTTPLETWFRLKGEGLANDLPVNEAAKCAGHVWEDFVAKMIPYMPGYEGTKVINDTTFYQHPEHKFMLANLDRRVILPDGSEGVGEIKTTNYRNYETIQKWKSGIVPAYYELQCRWYMAIMNLPFTLIICAWGFTVNDMAIIRIERDLKEEKRIINEVKEFLDSIDRDEPPTMDEASNCKLIMSSLDRVFGAGDPDLPSVDMEGTRRDAIAMEQIKKLLEERKALTSNYNESLNNINSNIAFWAKNYLAKLGKAEGLRVSTPERKYLLTYKTSRRTVVDAEKLKKEKPEVYDAFKKTTYSRRLSVSECDESAESVD